MRLLKPFAALCALVALTFGGLPAAGQSLSPFHWLDSSTVSITTGNSSANVALLKMPTGETQVRVYTSCASAVFIRKGVDSTATAAATDLPIAPGSVEVLTLRNLVTSPVTYMAMISPSGSCTIYFTTGTGF